MANEDTNDLTCLSKSAPGAKLEQREEQKSIAPLEFSSIAQRKNTVRTYSADRPVGWQAGPLGSRLTSAGGRKTWLVVYRRKSERRRPTVNMRIMKFSPTSDTTKTALPPAFGVNGVTWVTLLPSS